MNELDMLIIRLLGTADTQGAIVYASWYMGEYAPTILIGLFAHFLVDARGDYLQMRHSVVHGLWAGLLAFLLLNLIDSFPVAVRAHPAPTDREMILNFFRISPSSFPSGLTLIAAAVATAMWRSPGRSARWAFLGAAVWTGLSRVILMDNWPSDIIGSALLGWVSARAAGWLIRRWPLVRALQQNLVR